jgi:protein-disulfide isomerase
VHNPAVISQRSNAESRRVAPPKRWRARALQAAAIALLAGGAASCSRNQPPPQSSADLDERLRRLEVYVAKNADAIDFLNKVYDQQKKQIEAEEAREPAPDAVFAVSIADAVNAGMVEGPATAPVTVVKAFDFACPHCQRMSPVLSDLVKEYNGKLRVVYMDRVVHDFAKPAHLAACAAAKQGKYTAFKSAFWDKGFGAYAASSGRDQSMFEPDGVIAIAKGAGLDPVRLKSDMNGPACNELLAKEAIELDKFNVDGTPAFFVNGVMISGALSKDAFKTIIDERLKVAEASGVPAAQYYDKEILGKGEKKFRSKNEPKPSS